MTQEESRRVSVQRAAELKSRIGAYLAASPSVKTGFSMAEEYALAKEKIKQHLGATEEEWRDWRWQVRNRIADVDLLAKFLNLGQEEIAQIKEVGEKFRWSVSPHYMSLMDADDHSCPVRMQAVPCLEEIQGELGSEDPMGEELTSPAPHITRRYPDRLIINVTNRCAMYCRHCQRRRNIGEKDLPTSREELREALDYIRDNPELRDILITGGDPLTLSDKYIDWILTELDNIPHVEIKRIGSRMPVTMPQRITPELCAIFEKHHPFYLNTHFNHPKEVTQESLEACRRLAMSGVSLGNQAVLLKGINNNPHVMKKLNQELLRIHVRPYYIFHAKMVRGTTHFVPPVQDGIEIMEYLRGQTSGMAIPTYIINAPGGKGKTPILPTYLLSFGSDYVMIRNWEGETFKYPNVR